MRWKGREQSENIDDRRGTRSAAPLVGGGLGVLIVGVIIALVTGDPSALLGGLQQSQNQRTTSSNPANIDPEKREFVAVVLKDTEDVWTKLFQEQGKTYTKPKLVLFTGQVQSACGFASAAVGPFYCPDDSQVYLDTGFYDELKNRFGAPGEFAQAYVIAHEVGHHVQNLLGITKQVHEQQGRISEKQYNQLSVRLELQADFLAGVWAHHAQQMKNILDQRDIDDALRAANAIGDDTLQKQSQGYVVPDSFTHGTSEQRVRWFRKGWDSGDLRQGDTFSARNL